MRRRKVLGLVVVGIMILTLLGGCKQEEKLTTPVHIAALNGPTGMGMTKLINDNETNYEITLYQSADEIVGKIVSGEIDVACVPSNLAATLYQKTQKNIYLLATNTLGTLYIVENGDTVHSIEDLAGKTIVSSGQGSTPEFVLDKLLLGAQLDPEKDVTVKFVANHTDVVSELVANEGTIALLPQPHVTIATSKNDKVQIAIDLNETWMSQEQTQLPMGVIIANKTYVDAHKEAINTFLTDYEASVKFVNENLEEASEMMEAAGVLASQEIALKAIPDSHIVFMDATSSKDSLENFYQILSDVNPKAIGGSLPDEAFYYSK